MLFTFEKDVWQPTKLKERALKRVNFSGNVSAPVAKLHVRYVLNFQATNVVSPGYKPCYFFNFCSLLKEIEYIASS